jgi:hypothetical protein
LSCSSPMCCAAIRSGSGKFNPGSARPVCLWVVTGALMATFGIRICLYGIDPHLSVRN